MPNIPNNFSDVFDKKTTSPYCTKKTKCVAIIGYLSLFGWIAAMIIYNKAQSNFASFHLRQSIGLIITGSALLMLPLIGWILNLAVIVLWAIGLYSAIKEREYKVPFLGDFYQKHLDFIQ